MGAQVRNEIAVLKRVSTGHKNIVSLHDYFEVTFPPFIESAMPGPNWHKNAVNQ